MSQVGDRQEHVCILLNNCRIGFLATQGKDGPETSMAPYAVHQGNILLHLSRLARHTGNIAAQPSAGFMICTPETAMDSPLALPRLSLSGQISRLADNALAAARRVYLQAVPEAEPLFGFADFRLFNLMPQQIHWVGGFGSAREINLAAWRKICSGCNSGGSDRAGPGA